MKDEPGGAEGLVSLTGRTITDKDFRAFQKLILKEAGINLADHKRALLVGRLNKRLRALDLSSYGEYYRYVTETEDPDELIRMLDCICTNETHFFREPQHFELLRERILPRWEKEAALGKRDRRIRVWSAACSTGEEPYSLAMTLLDRFPPDSGWRLDILASDLSTKALDQAVAGVWSVDKSGEIPPRLLKRYMLRGAGEQEGKMAAGPALRNIIRFLRFNLHGEKYPLQGGFDLIFCRNVLIYFEAESKRQVVRRLLGKLAPDGYLFLGHAEGLNWPDLPVRRVIPTVYALDDGRD